MQISVIIPALNESARIRAAVASASGAAGVEVIVADGGSTDGTATIAGLLGASVISSTPGRAAQMNAGAGVATGDVLLFLHADTTLPEGYDTHVRETLGRPGTVAGAFMFRVDRPSPSLRVIEILAGLRCRAFGLPYGDQGIFVRADVFRAVGGYPDMPIMEDFELMRRVGRLGRVGLAGACTVTSARRWEEAGVLRMTLVNQAVILAYILGVPPERIKGWRG